MGTLFRGRGDYTILDFFLPNQLDSTLNFSYVQSESLKRRYIEELLSSPEFSRETDIKIRKTLFGMNAGKTWKCLW